MRDYRRLYGVAMTKLAAEAQKEEAPAPSPGAKLDGAIDKAKGYGNQLKAKGNQMWSSTKDFFNNPNNLKRLGFAAGGGILGALIGGPKHRLLGTLLGIGGGATVGDLVSDQSYIRDGFNSLRGKINARRARSNTLGRGSQTLSYLYDNYGPEVVEKVLAEMDQNIKNTNQVYSQAYQKSLDAGQWRNKSFNLADLIQPAKEPALGPRIQ